MYAELFQKSDRPFRATPDVRFYYPYDAVEQARQTVLRAMRRGEGPVAVMGSVGLGKSLLAQVLAEDLSDRFDVVCLHAARLCSRRAMLQAILFELQLPYRDLSEGELRLSLMERMEPSPELAPEGLALIVDEAQTLPTKLLEELRLITNFMRHGGARARLVLLGGLQLEETFALPEMSSFNQRLAARCFLQPMNRQQTADFVRHQFSLVQVDAQHIITRDALENVYIASEGIPRLVNQIMDHAMMLAITQDQYPISAALIQEAWADLQQLPVHWGNEPSKPVSTVEFGSIDDLDQDFELEPEGADELEHRRTPTISWPAMADLEDFGPASQQTGSDAQVALRIPAPVLESPKPSFGDHNSDLDLFVFTEEVEDASVLPFEGNFFTSWEPTPAPTMHVFELDRNAMHSGKSPLYPVETIPMPLTVASEASAGDPFGQDFDEEFPVDASHVQRWQANAEARRQAQATSRSTAGPRRVAESPQPAAVRAARGHATSADQQVNLNAKSFECSTMEWSAMSVAESAHAAQFVQPTAPGMISGLTIDVSQNAGAALQQDIEDLIGQLNFSAFSVELDTVEQISPEVSRRAAGASLGIPGETVRTTPKDSRIPVDYDRPHTLAMSPYDDDRDMLIIEEEIPSSMRHAQPVTVVPNSGAMAYPQLFQQLRG